MKSRSFLLYICRINMFIIDLELTSNTQIIMALTQTVLYQIQLPEFINKFKQACISRILPPIDYAIQLLKTTNNPILIVLLIVLFVQLIRMAINEVRHNKKNQKVSEQPDNRAANRQIKELKRQLKAIQKTIHQLKQSGMNKSYISGSQSVISNQTTKSIINSCKESWVKREEIAMHLIEYQTMLMNEVRQLKRSSSRISSPLKSNNPISVPSNNKNPKIRANLLTTKEEKKDQVKQIQKSEQFDTKQTEPKASKKEIPPKRKIVQVSKKIIEVTRQTVQQSLIIERQPVKQFMHIPQVIQITTRQQQVANVAQAIQTDKHYQPQNKQMNHNQFPIQQVEKQPSTIPQNNTQFSQDLKIQEPSAIIEEAPKSMPPLPKQAPSVGRRPPGPPQKGERKNPPPPPMRKI